MPQSFRMDATAVEAQRIRAFCKNAIDLAAEEDYKSIVSYGENMVCNKDDVSGFPSCFEQRWY